jgi:predicted nucleotide-binding protein
MAKRTIVTGPAPKISQSAQSIRMGIDRLAARIKELEAFDASKMQSGRPPELIALETSIQRSLEKTFGEDTADFRRFRSASELHYSPTIFIGGAPPTPLSTYQQATLKRRENALALLTEAVRTLNEDLSELEGFSVPEPSTSNTVAPPSSAPNKVFIVHGHDEGTRAIVKSFIEKLGFEAIVLHERPNKGRTIITKFQEEAADIGFAVVLMTPDDHGGKVGAATSPRARQNVVFELGFFYGALGAAHVVALVKGQLEKPSDFDGVVYVSMDSGNWQTDLGRELKAAGFPIDWNKVHA